MKHINNFIQHNEGIKVATRAWKGGEGEHYQKASSGSSKNLELKKSALFHLFRDVIGKNVGFKMKTSDQQKDPLEYVLIEVEGDDKKSYSGESIDYQQHFDFYFWADQGVKSDAPFAQNKKEVVLRYSFKHDDFKLEGLHNVPQMNRKLAKFLVQSANKLREMVVGADVPKTERGFKSGGEFHKKPQSGEEGFMDYVRKRSSLASSAEFDIVDDEAKAQELKVSKLKWSDFRCFEG